MLNQDFIGRLSSLVQALILFVAQASSLAQGQNQALANTSTVAKPQPQLAISVSATNSNQVAPNKPAVKPKELAWDELVPPSWDPSHFFKDIDLNSLQDNDPKAQVLLNRLREVWDQAPINPKLDGLFIRIPGFVVPLEQEHNKLKEFLLVPYFGACIHTPPPPANQIIHVQLQTPEPGYRSMDTVWVMGTLRIMRTNSSLGASGYRLEGLRLDPYLGPPPIAQ